MRHLEETIRSASSPALKSLQEGHKKLTGIINITEKKLSKRQEANQKKIDTILKKSTAEKESLNKAFDDQNKALTELKKDVYEININYKNQEGTMFNRFASYFGQTKINPDTLPIKKSENPLADIGQYKKSLSLIITLTSSEDARQKIVATYDKLTEIEEKLKKIENDQDVLDQKTADHIKKIRDNETPLKQQISKLQRQKQAYSRGIEYLQDASKKATTLRRDFRVSVNNFFDQIGMEFFEALSESSLEKALDVSRGIKPSETDKIDQIVKDTYENAKGPITKAITDLLTRFTEENNVAATDALNISIAEVQGSSKSLSKDTKAQENLNNFVNTMNALIEELPTRLRNECQESTSDRLDAFCKEKALKKNADRLSTVTRTRSTHQTSNPARMYQRPRTTKSGAKLPTKKPPTPRGSKK